MESSNGPQLPDEHARMNSEKKLDTFMWCAITHVQFRLFSSALFSRHSYSLGTYYAVLSEGNVFSLEDYVFIFIY